MSYNAREPSLRNCMFFFTFRSCAAVLAQPIHTDRPPMPCVPPEHDDAANSGGEANKQIPYSKAIALASH